MLKNAPTLAIVAVHTAENEPPKVYESPKKIHGRFAAGALADAGEPGSRHADEVAGMLADNLVEVRD